MIEDQAMSVLLADDEKSIRVTHAMEVAEQFKRIDRLEEINRVHASMNLG